MSAARTLFLLIGLLCVPITASAVTVHDIIELTKAGLSDDILIAVIDADRTVFTLDKDQILELKRAGVSRAVVLKMLRTRSEERAAASASESTSAAPPATPSPEVIVVPPPEPVTVVVPQYYYIPYPIWGARAPQGPRPPAQPFMSPDYRGFGRFINDGWIDRR